MVSALNRLSSWTEMRYNAQTLVKMLAICSENNCRLSLHRLITWTFPHVFPLSNWLPPSHHLIGTYPRKITLLHLIGCVGQGDSPRNSSLESLKKNHPGGCQQAGGSGASLLAVLSWLVRLAPSKKQTAFPLFWTSPTSQCHLGVFLELETVAMHSH